ncbi:MAG: ribokinase [candidate division KSB1 bacterium]|nr:ribokinase [candidate division KSB1 bacterium]
MNRKKIVVVGSYIVALVMETDRFPVKGETLMGRNFRQTFGGKGSNQAVQAARLGADVFFVGKIGNDSFGHDFLNLCKKEGVNHEYVFVHESLPTATGFIICAGGHNIITIDIAALNDFNSRDIDRASHLFTLESVTVIQLEIPLETAIYAAKTARINNSVVVLNPAPARNLTGMDLSCIDFLTPNETEARICAGLAPDDPCSDYEVGRKLLALGCRNVIITLGEKGSLLLNRNEEIMIPAFHIPQVVDSTGAGDAFNAAFAVAIAEGLSEKEAMRFGNAAGALSCTKADTIPSFPSRKEIERFLNNMH